MRQDDKFRLEQQTKRSYGFLRLKNGCLAVIRSIWKSVLVIGYIIVAVIVILHREQIFKIQGDDLFNILQSNTLKLALPILGICILLFILIAFGTPWGGKGISDNLWRIGLCNHAGESPLLLAKRKDKSKLNITVMEFETNGIPCFEWEDKRAKIEAALNVNIVDIKEGKGKRRIHLYTVSALHGLPDTIHWTDRHLSKDNFVLVLGENPLGQVTVNLAQIPHILLGGSTGSGKSVLLKLLLMQCLKKGAKVHIADFKGGVDFPDVWHAKCRIVTDETTLLKTLSSVVDELERRKKLLCKSGDANIDEYNKNNGNLLNRIIFACDEVAEVLDKTGLSKEDKELVTKIEGKMSIIARQGRAFGIHLILATQRPDATILSGQIRNNINCRVCGRADNVRRRLSLTIQALPN